MAPFPNAKLRQPLSFHKWRSARNIKVRRRVTKAKIMKIPKETEMMKMFAASQTISDLHGTTRVGRADFPELALRAEITNN